MNSWGAFELDDNDQNLAFIEGKKKKGENFHFRENVSEKFVIFRVSLIHLIIY